MQICHCGANRPVAAVGEAADFSCFLAPRGPAVVVVAAAILAVCCGHTDQPRLIEHRDHAVFDALPPVPIRLLVAPERAGRVSRYITAARAALQRFGEWYGPYPHTDLLMVDAGWSDVPPRPGAAIIRTRWLSSERSGALDAAVFHAVARRFWETDRAGASRDPVMLDALARFSSSRALEELFPNERFEERRYFGGFLSYPLRRVPSSRGDVGLAISRSPSMADRTTLVLITLERHIGWGALQAGLWELAQRRHATETSMGELLEILERTGGRKLKWLLDEALDTSKVFDYGIEHFESNPSVEHPSRYETVVMVRRYGNAVVPGSSRFSEGTYEAGGGIETAIMFEDGAEVREHWAGRESTKRYEYESSSRALTAIVDPDRVLRLDVNPANNVQTLRPASRAAAVWAALWSVWFEDFLLTYSAFF